MISFIICTKIVSNSIHQTQRNRKSVPIFIICICRRFWARVVVSIKAKNEQLFVGWCFIICLQLDNDPMNPIVCTSRERECLPSNIQRSEMKDDANVFLVSLLSTEMCLFLMMTLWLHFDSKDVEKEEKVVDGFHGALECQGYLRRDVIWLLLYFAIFFVKIQGRQGTMLQKL